VISWNNLLALLRGHLPDKEAVESAPNGGNQQEGANLARGDGQADGNLIEGRYKAS
jgi:hypothetical protein